MATKLKEMNADVQPGFYRPDAAAKYVSLSRRHLFTLTQRGVFAVIRIGHKVTLYSRADLDAGLSRLRTAAIGER